MTNKTDSTNTTFQSVSHEEHSKRERGKKRARAREVDPLRRTKATSWAPADNPAPKSAPVLPSVGAGAGAVVSTGAVSVTDPFNSSSVINHLHRTADPSMKMRSGLKK
ncbi:hypothetical protein A4X09_0g5389 [Tilletia walkeri]|uniref:Uncharacterized protein n=1 Tax=Tilletia walkeri TaxID=117179 RepID=A0A8X7N5I5_9BASI|nr:hypothetical protein A4X09_0g5389 [Tilletia walkeri]